MHNDEGGSNSDEVQDAGEENRPGANSDEDENPDDPNKDEIWRVRHVSVSSLCVILTPSTVDHVQVMQQTLPRADLDLMGGSESDDIPDGLDDDNSSHSEVKDAEEPRTPSDAREDRDEDATEPAEADEDSSGASVNFAEDDDDLVGSDKEVLIPSAFEPEDTAAVGGKRKPSEEDAQKGGRKK
jgi:hypothetical protein